MSLLLKLLLLNSPLETPYNCKHVDVKAADTEIGIL